MFGGVVKPAGWATILVAGGVVLGGSVTAKAADFGGDCCADLEERVAELEATTARKGNRKVSLTVYGQVNEAVMFWDDGFEQNAYVVTNDSSRTRFGFKGDAKIADGWKAKFKIEVGIRAASSKRSNQDDANGLDGNFDLRHAWWAIESKKYGTVHVGHTPTALEEVTEANVAGTSGVGKYSDVEDSGLGMILRDSNGNFLLDAGEGIQWRRLIKHTGDPPGEGERRQAVWYVSPVFNGFWVEAGWGGDDFWDVGARYEGEVGQFKVEARIGYGENTDESGDDFTTFGCVGTEIDGHTECHSLGGSFSAMHEPSGLYASFAAGWFQDDQVLKKGAFFDGADDTSTFWAVEAGLQQKWFSVGKTTILGQYYDFDGGASERDDFDNASLFAGVDDGAYIFSSGIQMWGVGIMQDLSNAGIKLYTLYRHYEADLTLVDKSNAGAFLAGTTDDVDLEDLDVVMSGAIIKF